jgi:hypothetical protein
VHRNLYGIAAYDGHQINWGLMNSGLMMAYGELAVCMMELSCFHTTLPYSILPCASQPPLTKAPPIHELIAVEAILPVEF